MADNLTELSIQEIRRRFLVEGETASPQLLRRMQRDPREGVRRIHQQLRKKRDQDKEQEQRLDSLLNFERLLWKSGLRHVAGVDEAGIGPLAGPVVAAAVVFPPRCCIHGIDDSKRLDPETRLRLAGLIRREATGLGIGCVEVEEIDELNIYHAGLLAMKRAVENLPLTPEHILVDARVVPDIPVPQNQFNKGDGINFSIAAASIIAKTSRDHMMEELDARYPMYGFARHKGYGTPDHQEAIRCFGPSPVHRRSFLFIRELGGGNSQLFYSLKQRLNGVDCADRLREIETDFQAARDKLDEYEQRKMRLLLNRRWQRF